jgi:membrane protein YqaA with SNARE-associated domain
MRDFLSLIAQHGYIIIFLIVFVEAIGMPVPAALALVAGGAAAGIWNPARSSGSAAFGGSNAPSSLLKNRILR